MRRIFRPSNSLRSIRASQIRGLRARPHAAPGALKPFALNMRGGSAAAGGAFGGARGWGGSRPSHLDYEDEDDPVEHNAAASFYNRATANSAVSRFQAMHEWSMMNWTKLGLALIAGGFAVTLTAPIALTEQTRRKPLPQAAGARRGGSSAAVGAASPEKQVEQKRQELQKQPNRDLDHVVTVGGVGILSTDSAAIADLEAAAHPPKRPVFRPIRAADWDRLVSVLDMNGLACLAYGGLRYMNNVMLSPVIRPYNPTSLFGVLLLAWIGASTVWVTPTLRRPGEL